MGLFIDPSSTERYVPKSERAKAERGEPHVVAILGILTVGQYAAVQNLAISNMGLDVRRGTHIIELVRYGLKGLEGPGAPPWDAGKDGLPSDEYLAHLTGALRVELADRIDQLNTVGTDEGKAYG